MMLHTGWRSNRGRSTPRSKTLHVEPGRTTDIDKTAGLSLQGRNRVTPQRVSTVGHEYQRGRISRTQMPHRTVREVSRATIPIRATCSRIAHAGQRSYRSPPFTQIIRRPVLAVYTGYKRTWHLASAVEGWRPVRALCPFVIA